ncbi:MAG: hypothetical protein WDN25_15245 [Acetobacteraceae bacterium]
MSGISQPRGAGSAPTPDATHRTGASGRTPAEANAGDAQRFADLLDDDAGDGGGGGGSGDESGGAQGDPPPPRSPAEAILASMGGLQPPAPVETLAGAGNDPAPQGIELRELADKIVDRVLVGQRADGENELRITLNSEMFGTTEVSLAQHQGALELRIDTLSEPMQKLLQDNAADFAGDLAQRLGMPVALEVHATTAADQMQRQGGDDRQRSRGYEQILRYVAESRS